jgi:hypothetical protein
VSNPKPIDPIKYPELAGVLPALIRARKRAEEIAIATGTELVQVVDGKVVSFRPQDVDKSVRRDPGSR